ncbi:MAG TPA: hypothetical protein VJ806_15385 [Luteimonas sp.]|nr:hypothetical protein [Luteimonas sp.]
MHRDAMRIFAFVLLLLAAAVPAHAARPVTSCDKAPGLADFRERLPDHVLSAAATKPAKLTSEPKFRLGGLFRRGGNLICVVLAVDDAGRVQDAAVSYPAGLTLQPAEREQFLVLRYSPAEIDGEPRPSLVTVTSYVR